jgi:aminoglycoside phosphotransferase family enzyme
MNEILYCHIFYVATFTYSKVFLTMELWFRNRKKVKDAVINTHITL